MPVRADAPTDTVTAGNSSQIREKGESHHGRRGAGVREARGGRVLGQARRDARGRRRDQHVALVGKQAPHALDGVRANALKSVQAR